MPKSDEKPYMDEETRALIERVNNKTKMWNLE